MLDKKHSRKYTNNEYSQRVRNFLNNIEKYRSRTWGIKFSKDL